MSLDNKGHRLLQLEYLKEQEYSEINKLQDVCRENDHTNLKLELDYKLFVGNNSSEATGKVNELLYYVDDTLVAYLGISCFGGNIGELNGMTHPNWRRQGIFKKLLEHAFAECSTRNFSKLLLLSDHQSDSGIACIEGAGGQYDFSEYRMKLNSGRIQDMSATITIDHELPADQTNRISIREATKEDKRELSRQNAIYFDDPNHEEDSQEAENPPNTYIYVIELNDVSIGKINVECSEDHTFAFIFGFGILPDYRGKGYGKSALRQTLQKCVEKGAKDIQLDVVCTNSNALNLYKACGFEEQSVMDYYRYNF